MNISRLKPARITRTATDKMISARAKALLLLGLVPDMVALLVHLFSAATPLHRDCTPFLWIRPEPRPQCEGKT